MKQGRSREGSWGARDLPFVNFFDKQHTNNITQVAKKRESEESTCHKSFLVLDNYILHFRTSAVDHVSTLGVAQCDPPPFGKS